jgi:hypothetical protein
MRPEIRRDASHKYYVGEDPEPWPSVTTIISATTPKELSWWGQKVACDGIAKLAQEGQLQDPFFTGESLLQLLKDRLLTVNHVLAKAMERGARIHGLLEYYAKTREIVSPSEFPEEYRSQIRCLAGWLLDNEPEFLGQEVMTCSPTFRYAGTLDLRCRIAGKLYILDLKTGKRVYPGTHFPQLEAYEYAEVELGEEPSDVRAVLHLPEGGPAKLVPSTYEFEDFLVLLNAYKRMQTHKRQKVA